MVNGCLDTIVCFIIVIITKLYGPYPINLRLLKDVVIYYPFISIQSLKFNLNVLCMRSRKIVSIRREYRVLVLDIKETRGPEIIIVKLYMFSTQS